MKTLIYLLLLVYTNVLLSNDVCIKLSHIENANITKLYIFTNDAVLTDLKPSFLDTIDISKYNNLIYLSVPESKYIVATDNKNIRPLNIYLIPGDTIELAVDSVNNYYQLVIKKSMYIETNFENILINRHNHRDFKEIFPKCTDYQTATNLFKSEIETFHNYADSILSVNKSTNNFRHYINNYIFSLFLYNKIAIVNLLNDAEEKLNYLETLAASMDSIANLNYSPENFYYLLVNFITKIAEIQNLSTKNNLNYLLNLVDIYFQNQSLNHLTKVKIIENELIYSNNLDLRLVKKILDSFSIKINKRYKDVLSTVYLKRLENESGAQMKEFILKDNYDVNHKLSEFKGRVTYVTFGATWCPPCIDELNFLQKYFQSNSLNMNIIVIFIESDIEKWKQFTRKFTDKFKYLISSDGMNSDFINQYLIKGIPKSFFLDSDHKILKVISGFNSSELREIIDKYNK